MALRDNVKVVINEDNQTTPKGKGTSSDIAYVPGLAWPYVAERFDDDGNVVYTKYYAKKIGITTREEAEELGYVYQFYDDDEKVKDDVYYKKTPNDPITCSDVTEFESYFGRVPYVMTLTDVKNASFYHKPTKLTYSYDHTYKEGDFDKSYIYAKELINQGLTVMYENMLDSNTIQLDSPSDCYDTTISDLTLMGSLDYKIEDGLLTEVNVSEGIHEIVYKPNKYAREDGQHDQMYGIDCISFSLNKLPVINGIITVEIASKYNRYEFSVQQTTPAVANVSVEYDNNAPYEDYKTYITLDTTDLYGDLTIDSFSVDINVRIADMTDSPTKNEADTLLISAYGQNEIVTSTSAISAVYDKLAESLDRITEKSEYSVKYITSGGYPTFINAISESAPGISMVSLAETLISAAEARGDAVALVDHADHPELSLDINETSGSVYSRVNLEWSLSLTNGTYGTMFTPWSTYTCTTLNDPTVMTQLMPASFGYLMSLAKAIKTKPNWLAMAGVTRGRIPGIKALHVNTPLTNTIAENYQPKFGEAENNRISVNAITNIKPYGLTIWGNRTLHPVDAKGTTALNFLNTRNMISDIKKLAYSTARSLMFEQDSDTLWLRFKSLMSPLLEQLKGGDGISDYKLIRGTTKYNGDPLTNGEMSVVIKIYPLYAIEYFEITVVMADKDVSVN